MNIFETYEHLMRFELERMVSAGDLPAVDFGPLCVEAARDSTQNDITTNAALIAAGKPNPGKLATTLARHFSALPDIVTAEGTETGFVNLRLKPVVWQRMVIGILHAGRDRAICNTTDCSAATDWTTANPVFSINQALTVACAIVSHGKKELLLNMSDDVLASAPMAGLTHQGEIELMRKLAVGIAKSFSGDSNVGALMNIAAAFRAMLQSSTGGGFMGFLETGNAQLSTARVALVRATMLILAPENR